MKENDKACNNSIRCKNSGRFTSKKKVQASEIWRRIGKNNSLTATNEAQTIPVEGNRILNLDFVSKQMICSSCKATLPLQNIVGETINCLASVFDVNCSCGTVTSVYSSEKYVNPATGRTVFSINSQMALGKYC